MISDLNASLTTCYFISYKYGKCRTIALLYLKPKFGLFTKHCLLIANFLQEYYIHVTVDIITSKAPSVNANLSKKSSLSPNRFVISTFTQNRIHSFANYTSLISFISSGSPPYVHEPSRRTISQIRYTNKYLDRLAEWDLRNFVNFNAANIQYTKFEQIKSIFLIIVGLFLKAF